MRDESATEPIGPDGRTYQQYLDERKLLVEGERAAGEAFDKTLLTLSAGAIALSVTFVEKLGSAGRVKPLLYISWAILAFGLLLNVRAFLMLQNSYYRLLDINDEIYETGTTSLRNPFRSRVGDFNQYAFWSFLAGISLLLLFAGVNYQASAREAPVPERFVIQVEDNKGIISRIVEGTMQKTGQGPNVVKLPQPAQGAPSARPSEGSGRGSTANSGSHSNWK